MILLMTSDYFLWLGFRSLFTSEHIVWVNEDSDMHNVLDADLIILDSSFNPKLVSILNGIEDESLKIILLTRDSNPIMKKLINYTDTLHLKSTVDNVRGFFRYVRIRKLKSKRKKPIFSPSEAYVLELTIDGESVKDIASGLGVNSKTVYAHRLRACRKLGAQRVCELIPYFNLIKSIAIARSSKLRRPDLKDSAFVVE